MDPIFHHNLGFGVFKQTPTEEMANNRARLSCSKQLLNDIIFIQFSDKKLFTLATPKSHRITACMHLLQQRIKSLEQNAFFSQKHSANCCDSVSKFCYSSLTLVDPEVKIN